VDWPLANSVRTVLTVIVTVLGFLLTTLRRVVRSAPVTAVELDRGRAACGQLWLRTADARLAGPPGRAGAASGSFGVQP
jgi:hypothetical protein